MARWLRTFLILSVVAILNIVGFMYMSGYSFIIWGTPVDVAKQIKDQTNNGNRDLMLNSNDFVAGILRKPVGEEARKNETPPEKTDLNTSKDSVFPNSHNQSGQDQNNLAQKQAEQVQIVIKQNESDNGEIKIQQPDQGQQQQQQIQNQQQISNVINPVLEQQQVNNNKQNIDANLLKNELQQMKAEMEAHQQNLQKQIISQGNQHQQQQQQGQQQQQEQEQQPQVAVNKNMLMGQQNVNPAVGSQVQMVGPHPDPHLKNIDPGILRDIVSKANPPNTQKVFPHDFHLDLNEPSACENDDGSTKDVFLVVLINSIHKNFEQRRAIRSTWGSIKSVEGKRVVTLFTLAKNSDKKLNEVVRDESEQYHDLLMEDFIDTYKNLTYKTIMGLKWAAVYCPQANYVMKTDDDMYVNYNSLVKYLMSSSTPTKNHVAGFVINGAPIRDPKSKWYMPKDLYPGNRYPPFCSGTGYVMSGDVALKVFAISEYTPFLYLEDVYVAICLEKLHIVPVKHREFNNWRTSYSYCRFKRIMTTHMVTPTEMNRIWKDQNSKKGYRC